MKRVPSRFIQWRSWLWPQPISQVHDEGQLLQLDLFRNEYMLSTPQAIYSWGLHYKPFKVSFKKIKNDIPSIQSFLLLGTGLGSALSILQKKYKQFPEAVLVDKSQTILDLSQHYMALNTHQNVQWICSDAQTYLQNNPRKFDAIGVDIFTDMNVEHHFKQEAFYRSIAAHLNPGGIAIFNNVFSSRNERDIVIKRMQQAFDTVTPIHRGINTFTIARIKK